MKFQLVFLGFAQHVGSLVGRNALVVRKKNGEGLKEPDFIVRRKSSGVPLADLSDCLDGESLELGSNHNHWPRAFFISC